MSIFDEIENLSKRYWSHEHKRFRVNDESFDRLAANFTLISTSIRETEQEAPKVALKELWYAALLLQQTLGRDTSQLTNAAVETVKRVDRIIAMNKAQFGSSLEFIEAQMVYMKVICGNPNVGIYKGSLMGKLITDNKDAMIIAKHPDMMKGLRSLRDEFNSEAQIFSLDDLPEKSNKSVAVLPCWPGHKSMDKLVRASLVDRYLIAGYDMELAWAEGYFNRVHSFPSNHILTDEEKLRLYPDVGSKWPSRPVIQISAKAHAVGKMVDEMAKTKKHHPNLRSVRPEENTEAVYCDLSGDYYAYLTEGFSPNVLVIKGDAFAVKEISMKDLDEGQLLVFRGESEDGAVQSVVESTHPESKQLRKFAKTWEREIKARFNRPIDLHNALTERKFKISYQAILIWHGGWLRIAPEDKNLDMLASVLGEASETAQNLPKIKDAAKRLGEMHAEAGQIISNALKAKISEVRDRINESGASIKIPNLGQLQIVQVETVDTAKQTVARNNTNKLLKQS